MGLRFVAARITYFSDVWGEFGSLPSSDDDGASKFGPYEAVPFPDLFGDPASEISHQRPVDWVAAICLAVTVPVLFLFVLILHGERNWKSQDRLSAIPK